MNDKLDWTADHAKEHKELVLETMKGLSIGVDALLECIKKVAEGRGQFVLNESGHPIFREFAMEVDKVNDSFYRIGQLLGEALGVDHPAMLDWARIGFALKKQTFNAIEDEREAYRAWFQGEQGKAYDGYWSFGSAAFKAGAARLQSLLADEEHLRHERDALAKGIRDAAVRAGICREDASLTGPMLLMLCNDLGELHAALSAQKVPESVANEIRETWNAMKNAGGQTEAYRLLERMVDRLGYGRTVNNPSLVVNREKI